MQNSTIFNKKKKVLSIVNIIVCMGKNVVPPFNPSTSSINIKNPNPTFLEQ